MGSKIRLLAWKVRGQDAPLDAQQKRELGARTALRLPFSLARTFCELGSGRFSTAINVWIVSESIVYDVAGRYSASNKYSGRKAGEFASNTVGAKHESPGQWPSAS